MFAVGLLGLSHRPEGESIYVEKCIGFISQLALINTCEKVLQTLYKMFMEEPSQANNNVLPIESYIYNLLHEVSVCLVNLDDFVNTI